MGQQTEPSVGIDLGTTYSVVAYLDRDHKPITLTNDEGELTTPSVVFFDHSGTIIGREAGAPYGSSAGALLVALLPLVLVGWRARPDNQRAIIRQAFVLSLPAYLLWVVGNGVSWFLVQTRLLFPIFPALALVGALGLEGLRTVKKPLDAGWLADAEAMDLVARDLAFKFDFSGLGNAEHRFAGCGGDESPSRESCTSDDQCTLPEVCNTDGHCVAPVPAEDGTACKHDDHCVGKACLDLGQGQV